jgi:hypothetical protein
LKDKPGRKAIGLEPDPNHINIAIKNACINSLEDQFTAINGVSAAATSPVVGLTTESKVTLDLPGYTVEDLMQSTGHSVIEILHCDAQGAEVHVVDQAISLGTSQRLRFCIISTHSYEITNDPLTHQNCLEKLRSAGAHIIAEHDVHESFSGDGLIAASFFPDDDNLKIQISCNRYSQSLFPSPAIHLSDALNELKELRALQLKDVAITNEKIPLIKRIGLRLASSMKF